MKCYIFVHSHLSSIQKGIQAAHVVAELVVRTNDGATWAHGYKTIVMLEGGNSDNLSTIAAKVGKTRYDYVYVNEDYGTLGGIMTAVGFIYNDKEKGWLDTKLMELTETTQLAS